MHAYRYVLTQPTSALSITQIRIGIGTYDLFSATDFINRRIGVVVIACSYIFATILQGLLEVTGGGRLLSETYNL